MKFRICRSDETPAYRERNRYPVKELKVGDYFVIPKDRVPKGRINGIGRRYGMKLSTKVQRDGSVRVLRVQ